MPLQEMEPVDLQPGGWRTLETFVGKIPRTVATFRLPRNVKLKVRYGFGWFGWNRQSTTTDGQSDRRLVVSG